jgi:hypothetical protein
MENVTGPELRPWTCGSAFEFYPLTETTCFMKKRDIRVAFSVDQAGKGQGLVVRERGAVVADATASVL